MIPPPPNIRPVFVLHFFFAEGCGHCHAALPHVEELQRRYPLQVILVQHNLTRAPLGSAAGWAPRATPGYAIVAGGRLVAHVEGMHTIRQLEKWIGKENLL